MASSGTIGKLPPGPAGPALLQSARYYRDPYGFLRACHEKYGDWFTIRQVPCGTLVHIAEPAAVRRLFAGDASHFAGRINAYMEPVLGRGLLLLDGEEHARERRWLAQSLADARIRSMAGDIGDLALAAVAEWPLGTPIPLRPRLEALALQVILRVVFGAAGSARLADLGALILRLKARDLATSVMAALPFGLAKWRLSGAAVRTAEAIDRLIYAELAMRRDGGVPDDGMVARLLASRPSDETRGASDRAIRDHLMTVIFAGHETVATTLAWTFERVTRHATVMAELEAAVATGDQAYLEAVILETMRQRSAIADVARELGEPMEIGGYRLPAGTRVCPAITLLHMRRDVFGDPEAFRPSRWLDKGNRADDPAIYLPFGGGIRRCMGAYLAMLEMMTTLRTIMSRVRVRAPDLQPERGSSNGVTIGPHRGALVVLEPR